MKLFSAPSEPRLYLAQTAFPGVWYFASALGKDMELLFVTTILSNVAMLEHTVVGFFIGTRDAHKEEHATEVLVAPPIAPWRCTVYVARQRPFIRL